MRWPGRWTYASSRPKGRLEEGAGISTTNHPDIRTGGSANGLGVRIERLGRGRATMGQEQWFCLFRGDAGPMAVPAESVAEVLDVDRLVRLAWSPPQVA